MKILITFFLTALMFSCSGISVDTQNSKDKKESYTDTIDKNIYTKLKSVEHESENLNVCLASSIDVCLNSEYTRLAREKKDEKYCEKLESTVDRQNCKDSVYITSSFFSDSDASCDKITDSIAKNNCINTINLRIATSKNDTKHCEKLLNKNKQQACKHTVYQKMAVELQDQTYCEKITDKSTYLQCIEEVKLMNSGMTGF